MLLQPLSNSTFFNLYSWYTYSNNDNISYRPGISYIYSFVNFDVGVRYLNESIYVSIQLLYYAIYPLFSSILDWYDPSQTIIIFPFVIVDTIHALSSSLFIVSLIHVSPKYFPISYRYFLVVLSGSVIPYAPWYLI